MVVADFDNDGNQDIAVATKDGNATILLGDGKGNFQSRVKLPLGPAGANHKLTAGDFDGDGKLDLAVIQEPDLAPALTGLSATSGKGGDTVTISGRGLAMPSTTTSQSAQDPGGLSHQAVTPRDDGSDTVVLFNGAQADIVSINATQIIARVPAAASTGLVTVTTPFGTGFSPTSFTFTGPDFDIGLDQSTVTAQAGTKARVTVNITRTGGFTGNVTVTPPDPAGGIKAKPADRITTTDTSASFKMKIGGGVAPGSYPLVFTGKDDTGRSRTATVTLIVQ
jgi:hypothetical protein